MICKAIYCQVQNYPLMTRHTKIVNDINCSTNIWNEALSKIRQWTLRRKMNFNFNLISRLKNSYFPVKWKRKIIHHYISVNIWDECYFNHSSMGVFFFKFCKWYQIAQHITYCEKGDMTKPSHDVTKYQTGHPKSYKEHIK